jgi:hypothetical protein
MTAAFKVIHNVDIADNIVQYLAHSRQDLFSLSLISRSISPMALDHLWKNLPTTYYILKLLPGFTLIKGKYVSPVYL